MYVLVIWAVLNGQLFADSALYKSLERCEESKAQALNMMKQNPNVKEAQGVCMNVLAFRNV